MTPAPDTAHRQQDADLATTRNLAPALSAGAFIVVAGLLLARLWMTRPDWFPALPAALVLRVSDALGGQGCCESVADAEALIVLAASFAAVAAALLLAALLQRALRPGRSESR